MKVQKKQVGQQNQTNLITLSETLNITFSNELIVQENLVNRYSGKK